MIKAKLHFTHVKKKCMEDQAIKKIKQFLDTFGGTDADDIEDRMWQLYEAALNSELSDGWDHNRRPDVYLFVRLIVDYFKGFIEIYKHLEPVLKYLATKFESESKKSLKESES